MSLTCKKKTDGPRGRVKKFLLCCGGEERQCAYSATLATWIRAEGHQQYGRKWLAKETQLLNNFKKSQWSSWYFKKDYAKSRIFSIKGQLFLMIFTKDHLLYLQKRLYSVVFYKISLVVRIFEKRLFYLPSLAIHSYP